MTDVASELKSCPHCGDLARLIRDERIFEGQHYDAYPGQRHGFLVECAGSCHSMTCWWHTEAEAISAWNRRTDTAVVGEEAVTKSIRAQMKLAFEAGRHSMFGTDKHSSERAWENWSRAWADDESLAGFTRSPTGGREAGLEEASRWHDEQAALAEKQRDEREWEADSKGERFESVDRLTFDLSARAHRADAAAIRALLPSAQKAGS